MNKKYRMVIKATDIRFSSDKDFLWDTYDDIVSYVVDNSECRKVGFVFNPKDYFEISCEYKQSESCALIMKCIKVKLDLLAETDPKIKLSFTIKEILPE